MCRWLQKVYSAVRVLFCWPRLPDALSLLQLFYLIPRNKDGTLELTTDQLTRIKQQFSWFLRTYTGKETARLIDSKVAALPCELKLMIANWSEQDGDMKVECRQAEEFEISLLDFINDLTGDKQDILLLVGNSNSNEANNLLREDFQRKAESMMINVNALQIDISAFNTDRKGKTIAVVLCIYTSNRLRDCVDDALWDINDRNRWRVVLVIIHIGGKRYTEPSSSILDDEDAALHIVDMESDESFVFLDSNLNRSAFIELNFITNYMKGRR